MAAWVGWRPGLYITALDHGLKGVSSEGSLMLVEQPPKTAGGESRLPAAKEEARQAGRGSGSPIQCPPHRIHCAQRSAPRVRTVSPPASV